MKKGMKLIAVAMFIFTTLVLTDGHCQEPTPSKEDEAIFTGQGFAYWCTDVAGKERKLYDWLRNLRVIFKKDGTYTTTGQIYYLNTKWSDTPKASYKYAISDDTMTIFEHNYKYSYDGRTLILKTTPNGNIPKPLAEFFGYPEAAGESGGLIVILSSKTRASFIPLKKTALSIPSFN